MNTLQKKQFFLGGLVVSLLLGFVLVFPFFAFGQVYPTKWTCVGTTRIAGAITDECTVTATSTSPFATSSISAIIQPTPMQNFFYGFMIFFLVSGSVLYIFRRIV